MNASLPFLLATLLSAFTAAPAQQPLRAAEQQSRTIQLDVVVSPKSGPPVSNLQQQDFTLMDNQTPRPIKSFKAVTGVQEPVRVILVLDAVNSRFDLVAYARAGLDKFLRQDGGKLSHPTSLAILTDNGAQIQQGFSTDGNGLSTALDQYTIGLRNIRHSSNWGEVDRLQISLKALRQLTQYTATVPGRKLVLWISPGWPILSGPRQFVDAKEARDLFADVVSFSTQLRLGRTTLYDINPVGVAESLIRADYYQSYLKGVKGPDQTEIGDLSLQVLAVQSGGLTFESNSDVAALLNRSLADAQSWYEITFDSPEPERPNEYHHVEIKVDKPGLTARTRDGYYAQR